MTLGWGLVGIGTFSDLSIAPAIIGHQGSRLAAVDVVHVATPNALHREHSVAALRAGKHVLVEKPVALSSGDGRAIVEAAAETGLLVGVGFHLRHKATNVAVRDLVRSDRLGRLFLADLTIAAGKDVYPYGTWGADLRLAGGGGAMLNPGTHVLDLLRFLTGREVVEVACMLARECGEEVVTAMFRLDGGLLATLTSQQMQAGIRPEWTIAGEDAWPQGLGATTPWAGDEVVLRDSGGEQHPTSDETTAYEAEIDAFATAVRAGGPVSGDAEDGLRNIEIFEALYRAARERRVVPVAAAP